MKLIILLLTCSLMAPLWAKDIRHSEFNFKISAKKLKGTDLNYSFTSVNKETFNKEAGPFAALLTQNHDYKKGEKFALIRAVFPIKKAIGHFDTDKFNDLKFTQKIESNTKVRKIKENTFLTQVSYPVKYQFFSKYHFDADDISSLPDSRIGRKIMELKNSDPLLQSANLSIFREMFGYTQYINEGSEFFGFISLDEETTLVVFMKLSVFSSDDILDYAIERDFLKKVKTIKTVLEKS